jgi:uncharacterized protein (DUF2336 family)
MNGWRPKGVARFGTEISVGLTAQDMSDVHRLAQLAANPQDTTREELYLAVASLYRVQDIHLSDRERGLMNDILRRLTKDVEMAIRIALAERLADDPSAPHNLILMLADDRIEVARPIIMRSPLLTEVDMLKLIAECGAAHHEALAARPKIGLKVCEALAASDNESVLCTLVHNATAHISPAAFERLAEKSRRIEALREPLAGRTDLPAEVATRMCTFVSETLKTFIVRNFSIPPETLESTVAEASAAMLRPHEPAAPGGDNARKLIDKLFLAGQLKAGFLIRVLQQGNIDLFELGLARLLDMKLAETRQLLYENGPRPVALACRAVGIDRCVFPTVYNLSRKARAIRPTLAADTMVDVDDVFGKFSKTDALKAIQTLEGRPPA